MGNILKLAIVIGLVGAILLLPELLKRSKNIKGLVLGFIIYLILFTIIGFVVMFFI